MIVLDTNVVSETMRAAPDPAVMAWLARAPAADLWTTAITQAELLVGVRQLPKGRRRDALERDAAQVFDADLAGRVLPFDGRAADAYSVLSASLRERGRPMGALDCLIAAIALSVDATLATRDVDHFASCGLTLVNPWRQGVTAPAGQ